MAETSQPVEFDIAQVLAPSGSKSVRQLPRLVSLSLALVWRSSRREFVLAVVLQLIASGGLAAQLLLGQELLAGVTGNTGRQAFLDLVPVLLGLAAATTVVQFANVARGEQQRVLAELVTLFALRRVIDVATAVDLVQYDAPQFHDRLQRARANAASRPLQIAVGMIGLLSSGLAIIGISVALLVLSPILLVIVLVGCVPAWYLSRRASHLGYDYAVEQTERQRRRTYLFSVLVDKSEAKEVRAFGLAPYLTGRHDALYTAEIDDLRVLVAKRLRLGLFAGVAASVVLLATVGALLGLVLSGRLALESAATAAGAVVLLGSRLRALAASLASLYEGALFLEDFTSFADSIEGITAKRPTAQPPLGFDVLDVEDVSFTYPSRSAPAVDGVTLQIRKGEVIALVGENGSGKTTLAKLLAGLYLPASGHVCWDGLDLSDCDPEAVRRQISVIFQDFTRYQLTVAENIGAGRVERDHDLAGIEEAARRAGAHQAILRLREGYETRLGPEYYGGSDLSGGQWQRLALARAFFRDAPFLILDEPTAALDPRAEAALFNSVRSLYADRTVLLVSHRFSTVRTADRILVMDAGRIIESGTHAELLALRGRYAELFSLQASAYLNSVT